jgi:hypothetical protein
VTLARLVEERRFDWRRPAHRRALFEDDLSPELVAELAARMDLPEDEAPSLVEGVVEGYRRVASVSGPAVASWLAQRFALLVNRKRCRRCRELKPRSKFPPNRKTRDRLSSWCRECHREATRRWRAANREAENARRRRGRRGG